MSVQIEKERRKFEKRVAESSKPKLFPKSVQLGEAVNLRLSQQIIESVEARNRELIAQTEKQQEDLRGFEEDLLSDFDLPLQGEDTEGDFEDSRSCASSAPIAAAPSPSSLSVYDRLAERGRSYAEKRLNWQPPDDNVRLSFVTVVVLPCLVS